MRRSLLCFALLCSAPTALAQEGEEIGSATSAFCCGSRCCFIEGRCRRVGDWNPRNPMEMCNPTISATEWSVAFAPPRRDAGTADAGRFGRRENGGGGLCSALPQGGHPGAAAVIGLALLGLTWRRRCR